MADFTYHQLVSGMRRLRGQFCTLSFECEIADELRRRGLMRFNEWPSGHWAITDEGHNFLANQDHSA